MPNIRIVIADDETVIRQAMAQVLRLETEAAILATQSGIADSKTVR